MATSSTDKLKTAAAAASVVEMKTIAKNENKNVTSPPVFVFERDIISMTSRLHYSS
jgi:hypothetical protein